MGWYEGSNLTKLTNGPELVFHPLAYLKFQFFCHNGRVEVSGMGITKPSNPLYIERFETLKQQSSAARTEFDDDAIPQFFEDQLSRGRQIQNFFRVWLHTHPGDSCDPSGTDEETFQRVFGNTDWAVMFIMGRGGDTYCRLKFNAGPSCAVLIPTRVDWDELPTLSAVDLGALQKAWKEEYDANVQAEVFRPYDMYSGYYGPSDFYSSRHAWEEEYFGGWGLGGGRISRSGSRSGSENSRFTRAERAFEDAIARRQALRHGDRRWQERQAEIEREEAEALAKERAAARAAIRASTGADAEDEAPQVGCDLCGRQPGDRTLSQCEVCRQICCKECLAPDTRDICLDCAMAEALYSENAKSSSSILSLGVDPDDIEFDGIDKIVERIHAEDSNAAKEQSALLSLPAHYAADK